MVCGTSCHRRVHKYYVSKIRAMDAKLEYADTAVQPTFDDFIFSHRRGN